MTPGGGSLAGVRAYKFTAAGAVGRFTGFPWPLPADGNPGAWVEATSPLTICATGIHACAVEQLPHWLGPELWEVEVAGEVVKSTYKLVAARGRLLRRVGGWPGAARSFAESCAARVREMAAAELHREGLPELAGRLLATTSSSQLAPVVAAARDVATPLVATLTGYTSDCLLDVANGDYAMCAYVAATAFANLSTGDVVQDMSSPGWAEERERQADWLATRLVLG